jgi:dTDP-glucose pyrophosphorylase
VNYLILAGGRSKRFGRNKLEEQFEGRTLPEMAVEFAVENGATNIFVTLSKSDVGINGPKVFHPIVDRITNLYPWARFLFQNEDQYGPGAAITKWSGLIDGPFVVLFGDNYYRGKINPIYLDQFKNYNNKTTYFTTESKSSNPRNLQLAAVIDQYIIEKPHSFIKGEYFCGMVRFPAGCFDKFNMLRRSDRGEIEIADMVNMSETPVPVSLARLGVVWDDLTYLSDIPRLQSLIKNEGK